MNNLSEGPGMRSLADIERVVWERIREATARKQSNQLKRLIALVDEMESRRREWAARLDGAITEASKPVTSAHDFTGKPIMGFEFKGERVTVNTYKGLLLGVSDLLRQRHKDAFDRTAIALHGKKRPYFSIDAKRLKSSGALNGGGLFAETNLNANLIVGICRQLVADLGYPDDALVILTK